MESLINSFYHDAHNLAGKCDYVMANPPFNVDKVKSESASAAGRSKSQIHSVLDDIQGIGPKTQQALLKHFKSVKRVSEASLADIQAVIGKAKGNVVYNVLNNKSIGEK